MAPKTQRRKKYCQQRSNAIRRSIPWKISFTQWCLIWARSGHWDERGKQKGQYVMARFGNKGPYAPWNVKIIQHNKNISEGLLGNKNSLGYKHTDEARANISSAMANRKVSTKTRKNLSKALMGNKNSLGREVSTETREKIAAAQIGKIISAEARAKMSAAKKGTKLNPEIKEKMKIAQRARRLRERKIVKSKGR